MYLLLAIEQFIRLLIFSGSEFQVNPQFYAFRWITLLLTQEFNFADSLHIWDTLLSDPDGPQVQMYNSYLTLYYDRLAFRLVVHCLLYKNNIKLLLLDKRKRREFGST